MSRYVWPHSGNPEGTTGCPHADIRFCPLYRAAHEPHGLGCMDGREGEGGCAVDRGMVYAEAIAKLDARDVAELRFREEAEVAAEQRRRNLGAAGLH